MLNKLLPYSTLAAVLLTAPSFVSAQSLGPLQGITDTLGSLSGGLVVTLVDPLQATTAAMGLNSSPLFNVLPSNPLLITYDVLLKGPENTIVISDLLQGNLIINNVLSGLPGGDVIQATYSENLKPFIPTLPLIDGLINSQL
ncbi:hypothetical protein [uncultured Zhongshania sp.]|jgi:hypothetical protein|uniref:hypothetical protein n=1 Tax=uncultured Zhongshania sp. TaxID=1642288 RepID=UPI0025F5375E|nr:hypothetical protein [uncultured Zhongshania sp.]